MFMLMLQVVLQSFLSVAVAVGDIDKSKPSKKVQDTD